MAEERSSKGQEGGVLGEGMFPSSPAIGGLRSTVVVQGEALAIWRFRTFYRLTKPLLVSILLTKFWFTAK